MIIRTCVVIPAYNNTSTISDVVKDVVLKTQLPVLIVDDGSQTPVTDSLYSWDVKKAMSAGRVRVVRFAKRQGHGAALQFAIRDLVQQGFTHMVTMDGDGEYLASQIDRLAAETRKNPWSLIVGQRKNTASSWIARMGRRLSNWWVSYQTNSALHDTQSGFRMYPLIAVQGEPYIARHFDWEMEVLIRLLWHGVNVQETEVSVSDRPRDDVGHFHRIWDNLRLGILFGALALISLLKGHRSPARLAIAVGTGVMIGFTPWLHWQFALVLAASLLLRLNGVAMALGGLVASPPLVSLTMLSAIYVGQRWLGVPMQPGFNPHWLAWLWGGLLVGSLAALSTAGILYFTLRLLKRSEKWSKFKLFYRGLASFYQRVYPAMGFWRRQNEIFRHGWSLLRIRAGVGKIDMDGREALHTEVERHGRVHLLTARLSGMNAALRQAGLSHNSYVSWQMDGHTGGKMELIRFFGRLAPFDVSGFESAVNTGLPVFSCFASESDKGIYTVQMRGPKICRYNSGLPQELQIYAWTERFATELEAFLQKHPRAWAHGEDFWTLPAQVTPSVHRLFEELPLPKGFDSGWTRDEQFTVQV